MPLTFDQVSKIVSIIDNSSCEELIVETDDIKLVVRRRVSGTPLPRERPEHPAPVAAVSETTPATTFAAPKTSPKPAAVGAVDGFSRVSVDAPMVGTFYRSPAPDKPDFVTEGAVVTKGDPLCLIEVMKLFTTVYASVTGRIEQILPASGELVEYGQTLFVIVLEDPGEAA